MQIRLRNVARLSQECLANVAQTLQIRRTPGQRGCVAATAWASEAATQTAAARVVVWGAARNRKALRAGKRWCAWKAAAAAGGVQQEGRRLEGCSKRDGARHRTKAGTRHRTKDGGWRSAARGTALGTARRPPLGTARRTAGNADRGGASRHGGCGDGDTAGSVRAVQLNRCKLAQIRGVA